ncbi:radical SAM protein [Butyrivibrio sp. VCD2006]|uniref:radical SAM protein n=1 Tax=Butyrivibrio sp. VCD2006 TaxID=1280664 RepID=UPI00041BD19C|nr:radical SAM protein [Butyrivibrio sp. VCD2006]
MSYPEEKLTRFCILPWGFMQVHAGGMMQCCAVSPDIEQGDFLIDYCQKEDKNEEPFDSIGLQMMRKGLMTGNLRPMCRNCFFVADERITTTEFEKRLKAYLCSRNRGIDVDNEDLSKVHAYYWMAISFTNRCNLSCIYCVQSTQKNTNPYYKMEFPYEYARMTLELFAKQGIDKLSTCVEGEATLYPYWYELISEFRRNYPDLYLAMTTNLNRKFSDDEITLLAKYNELDVSIDSMNQGIYAELRRNGKLELLLENVEKIQAKVKELGIKGPSISFHTVLSDRTWQSLEDICEYAFSRGIGVFVGNYEKRSNTLAEKEGLVRPISELSYDVQTQVFDIMQKVKRKAEESNTFITFQGDILSKVKKNVEVNYNEFEPYDDREIINRFIEQYHGGKVGLHLAYAYDDDNISHEGILIAKGEKLLLKNLDLENAVVREIEIYKDGKVSNRYGQKVKVGYRKSISIKDGVLEYTPSYGNESIQSIVLEIF